jgi:hypothetical protein
MIKPKMFGGGDKLLFEKAGAMRSRPTFGANYYGFIYKQNPWVINSAGNRSMLFIF